MTHVSGEQNKFVYSGTKVLENLQEAKNYNGAVLQLTSTLLGLTPNQKVLDFGAGVGTFAHMLMQSGISVECLEVDETERIVLQNKGFTVHADLRAVENGVYDAIYSLNVLEHIKDDTHVLQQLHTKLKEKGRLFIFVPAMQLLYSDFDKMVGHYRRYHMKGLRKIVENSGYEIEDIRYFDSTGFFAALLFKLLGGNPSKVTPEKIRFFDRIVFPFNQLCDPLLQKMFGKNLYVICRKK